MRHSVTISIEKNNITSSVFIEIIEQNQRKVHDLLTAYHYEEKGSVERFQIQEDTLHFTTEFVGSFKVAYLCQYYYACANQTNDFDKEMLVDFTIDGSELTLIGHELWEIDDADF